MLVILLWQWQELLAFGKQVFATEKVTTGLKKVILSYLKAGTQLFRNFFGKFLFLLLLDL